MKHLDLDTSIKNYWRKANEALKAKNMDEANDLLDYCLVILGTATLRGNVELGGVRVDLWKERVWYAIENNGFLIVNVLNSKKNESFNLKETSQQFEKFGPLKPVYGLNPYSVSTLTTDFLFTLSSSSIPALSTSFINSLTFP